MRQHPHTPEPLYSEFAEWQDNTALTGTAAALDPWVVMDWDPDDPFDRVDLAGA